jgi:hypothetical protein
MGSGDTLRTDTGFSTAQASGSGKDKLQSGLQNITL